MKVFILISLFIITSIVCLVQKEENEGEERLARLLRRYTYQPAPQTGRFHFTTSELPGYTLQLDSDYSRRQARLEVVINNIVADMSIESDSREFTSQNAELLQHSSGQVMSLSNEDEELFSMGPPRLRQGIVSNNRAGPSFLNVALAILLGDLLILMSDLVLRR